MKHAEWIHLLSAWTPHKVTERPREWKHRAEAERRGRGLERAGLVFFFYAPDTHASVSGKPSALAGVHEEDLIICHIIHESSTRAQEHEIWDPAERDGRRLLWASPPAADEQREVRLHLKQLIIELCSVKKADDKWI